MRSEAHRLLRPLLFGSLLLLCSSWFTASAQVGGGLSIRITAAPRVGGGPAEMETLRARVRDADQVCGQDFANQVCGQDFANCRVALFSYVSGFGYYPQPLLSHQLSGISPTGLVDERVHLGSRYAALLVFADNYRAQPETVSALPLRFARAHDEVAAGTQRPVEEAEAVTSPADATNPAPLDVPASPVTTDSVQLAAQPASSPRAVESARLFDLSSVLTLFGLVLLLALLLHVSGRFEAFVAALAFSLRKLISRIALGLKSSHASVQKWLRAREEGTGRSVAAKDFTALTCFVTAIGAAAANYLIVKFSLDLLLPMGEALTILAIIFVALKGVCGILLHFFTGRRARLALIVALLLASACDVTLAYRRVRAIQELNALDSIATADAPTGGVQINEAVLGGLGQTGKPAAQPNAPTVATVPNSSSLTDWLFTQDAPLVAAFTLVTGVFEVLCVFGAFGLSATGVVWVVTLPVWLPLGLMKEGFALLHRTKLTKLVSILIYAAGEAPKVITIKVAENIRGLYRTIVDGIKRLRVELASLGPRLAARWHRRKLAKLEYRFHETELDATLRHRAVMNKKLRDMSAAVLQQNLADIETLFRQVSANLIAAAEQQAQRHSEAQTLVVAEGTTKAAAELYAKTNHMLNSIDGFYPKLDGSGPAANDRAATGAHGSGETRPVNNA